MQALAPPLSTSLYQDTWCFHSSLLWPGVTEPPSTFSLPLVSGLLSNWTELPALVRQFELCAYLPPSLLHILLYSCVSSWFICTAQHWNFNSWEHLQHHGSAHVHFHCTYRHFGSVTPWLLTSTQGLPQLPCLTSLQVSRVCAYWLWERQSQVFQV